MYADTRFFLPTLLLIVLAGCTRTPPPALDAKPLGVTANSGGDTRGTISYRPGPVLANAPDPYTTVSSKIALPQRQKLAWELAEIDSHAHRQAANSYPVPEAGSLGYSKSAARDAAARQALFDAYLLEKYHARFCNQFHITYDQLTLIIQEGRDKNWPMPPSSKE